MDHRFDSFEDIEFLRYDTVTNMVHYVRPEGNVCIMGVEEGEMFKAPSCSATGSHRYRR
jgi:hypothetical protein